MVKFDAMTPVEPSVHWLADAPNRPRRVALGSFDGLHVGHRRVIAGADTVVTFSPHPRAVLGNAPPLLHDLDTKIELLGRLGISEVVLVPFDRELAATAAADFVDRILVEGLTATHVAVGANFRFGRRGAGRVAELLADRRFETLAEPLIIREGDVVSSTRIRGMVRQGRIDAATRLLGGPFESRCALERDGECSGRLSWPSGIVRPGPGAYAGTVRRAGGEPVAAEVVVGADEARLFAAAPLAASGSAVVALERRVREASRELIGSAAA